MILIAEHNDAAPGVNEREEETKTGYLNEVKKVNEIFDQQENEDVSAEEVDLLIKNDSNEEELMVKNQERK